MIEEKVLYNPRYGLRKRFGRELICQNFQQRQGFLTIAWKVIWSDELPATIQMKRMTSKCSLPFREQGKHELCWNCSILDTDITLLCLVHHHLARKIFEHVWPTVKLNLAIWSRLIGQFDCSFLYARRFANYWSKMGSQSQSKFCLLKFILLTFSDWIYLRYFTRTY